MPALFHGYGAVDISSCTALAVAQGLTVVLPRRPRRVALRIPHTWAAILPPAAFLATVAGLAMHPSLALAVVGVACVGVPVLGALAMAAFARGGRPARALVVVPLLALAALQVGVAGEVAVLMLVMLSCVALGSLLAACAGVRELVVAALLVAVLDLVLMQAGGIRIATAALLDAHIEHLPDFAQPVLGRMTIGYGDFFVAALAGAIAARQPSHQTLVALATTAFALAQYALSTEGDLLPATAPVAVAMLVAALATRWRRRRRVMRYAN
jgi:MYXO-CTERM domain-containing protein